ncbi:MAG: CBS domain-containing protein [Salinivirgaceae bacterium]|jgi:predicted transcriptional regulator|nr:CBS domain-containing protein [Salinivirgaceae bacterium]
MDEQTVENLMTNVEDIIVGKLDDTPQQLMNIMTTQRIRHIPIIENENIVGIVSIGDLIKLALENSEVESRKLREFIKNPFINSLHLLPTNTGPRRRECPDHQI